MAIHPVKFTVIDLSPLVAAAGRYKRLKTKQAAATKNINRIFLFIFTNLSFDLVQFFYESSQKNQFFNTFSFLEGFLLLPS